MTELRARMSSYGYDNLYRLTSETIASDPYSVNGLVSYTYDPVGNRTQKTSTLPGMPGTASSYNANDQLATDTYDAEGNTTASNGKGYVYDFENHLIQQGSINIVYDGDGNRVSKTIGGTTISYLVDTQNPTGYAQVIQENYNFSGNPGTTFEITHSYVYGLERISERRYYFLNNVSTYSNAYYVYDGHRSVRALTDQTGTVTDTYDYDAFGNMIHSTGSTPNNYLFAGEQYDPDLNLYYNRARYLNVATGRFWTVDRDEGDEESPISLHKYLYAIADPVDGRDPSGFDDLAEVSAAEGIQQSLQNLSLPNFVRAYTGINSTIDAIKVLAGIAAVGYGLLMPQRDFAGIVYDFNLNAATGGTYPDVKLGVERRWNGDGTTAIVLRVAAGMTRFRLKFGSNGITSFSGGVNINLLQRNAIGADLKMDLGARVGQSFGGNANPQLYVFLEFSLNFQFGIPNDVYSLAGQSALGKFANGLGVSARTKALVIPLAGVFDHAADLLAQLSVADEDSIP
jgi:RHS repeat-associated protein